MIITREYAKNLSKQTLADLASQHATEFAHLLGHEGDVDIKPEEIIYDKNEARAHFLEDRAYKDFLGLDRKAAKFFYKKKKSWVRKGSAFVENGVAFIPLSRLSEKEENLVKMLQPKKDFNWYSTLPSFFKKRDYMSLQGFGAEIGHLTGDKIYSGKTKENLGEALDVASQLLELSKDITFLGDQCPPENLDSFSKELCDELLSGYRVDYTLCETLLLEGKAAALMKMTELGPYSLTVLDIALSTLQIDYITTTHYDGKKLFLEVHDSVEGDFDKTYKKLGSILSNPNVDSMESALKELGYSAEELSKYEGVFGTIQERASRICQHNTPPSLRNS